MLAVGGGLECSISFSLAGFEVMLMVSISASSVVRGA